MSFVAWFVLGVIAGLIAGLMYKHRAADLALDAVLGAAGAVCGGLAFTSLGSAGVNVFNIYSWFGAVAGAIAILAGYRAIFQRV